MLLTANDFPPCTVVIMHIKDELYPTPRPRPPPSSSKPQPARLETDTAADPSSSSSSNSGPRRSPRLGSVQPSSLAPGSSFTTEDNDDDAEEEEEEEEDDDDETVQERIERELNELERKRRTGVKFLLAEQGMRIRKFLISLFWFWVNSGWECRAPDSFLLSWTHRVLSAPAAPFRHAAVFLSITTHCVPLAYAA